MKAASARARSTAKSAAISAGPILCGALALTAALLPRTAHAEPTPWFSGGGGVSFQRHATTDATTGVSESETLSRPAMTFALGLGTSPAARFAVGGLFRVTTTFTQGTDLTFGPRLATGGFVRGDFGLALDLGVTYRTWRNGDFGRVPLQATLLFGVPFGFQAGVSAQALNLDGGKQSAGMFAVLELDVLRLTVLRQGSSTRFWENPAPLGGKVRELSRGPLLELLPASTR